MKTAIRTILCAVAVVMAAVSCQKSAEPVQPAEEGKETIDICVNGLMGEYVQQDGEAVKSSLVNTVRVAWAAGDVVYVFDGTKYLGKLTATLDKKAAGHTDEDRYAKLSGTISAPATTPCMLSLVHSSLMAEPAAGAEVSELSIDMSAQSTATVPFVAYATLDYTGSTTITNAVVPFQFATSVIKVNCTGLKANTAITSAKLSNVNTACKLTLSGVGVQNVSGDVNGTITRTGDEYFANTKINDEGEAVFQIAVPKLETASGARVLTVAQSSDKAKDKKFTTKSLNPATSVNTVCQLVGLPVGALEGEFTVSDDDGATTKQIYFSQGNLVATINATGTPTAWKFAANQYDYIGNNVANTSIGTKVGDVDLFGWSTDAASNNWGIHTKTSVIANFIRGNFKDWGTNIDDKGTWRTLSTEEWQYLFNTRTVNGGQGAGKSYSLNITYGGKMGLVLYPDDYDKDPVTGTVTDLPDGVVFLPAAGYRDGSNVYDVGEYGYYWSSSADGNDYAYYVDFSRVEVSPDRGRYRYYGSSVRLITESK